MGLDQYAIYRKHGDADKEKGKELAYWRKHNRLQGWMEKLYIEKGGKEAFNCVEVQLTAEDIGALEEAMKNHQLPETQGFFFGDDSYEDYEQWHKKDDQEFIKNAKKKLADGYEIFYSSWW